MNIFLATVNFNIYSKYEKPEGYFYALKMVVGYSTTFLFHLVVKKKTTSTLI